MANIGLTNGESYVFGKVNDKTVILNSTDSANAPKVVRNQLQIIIDESGTGTECLYLHNDNTGTGADTFIHFEEGGGIDWVMGIDATDNHFKIHQGASIVSVPDFEFQNGGTMVHNISELNKVQADTQIAIGTTTYSFILHVVAPVATEQHFISKFTNEFDPGAANDAHGILLRLGGTSTGIATQRFFHRFDNLKSDNVNYTYIQGGIRGLGEATRGVEFHSFSDGRYKHNVAKTQYGLDTLMKLDVVDYSSDPEMSANTTGFIAQDVYKHYPVGVHKPLPEDAGTEGDIWTMSYAKLTPLLVQSVQDLQEQIRDLQSEIKQLKGNNK